MAYLYVKRDLANEYISDNDLNYLELRKDYQK